MLYHHFFSKGDYFHNYLFAFLDSKTKKVESVLKGKNLPLLEQILSF